MRTQFKKWILLILIPLILSCSSSEHKQIYDIVIQNARIIDPETETDSILQVGIIDDKIAAVTGQPIKGKVMINGKGKVLAPGFIDLHAHGQTNIENAYQAFDGVTTALELEIGIDTLSSWFKFRKDKALLNYGASACQIAYRNKIIRQNQKALPSVYDEITDSISQQPLPEKDFAALEKQIRKAINEGAIGIGIPVGYLPAASVEEITAVYTMAGKWNVPVFTHVREGGAIAFQQAIADAILNRTQLHICHINSMARKDILPCLDMIRKSQTRGFPITTELYPYTAGNTEIGSSIFNEGWQERLGCSYHDLQWVETGERLTPETFEKYRKKNGQVIIHMLKEDWIRTAISSPFTMIASDGGNYSTKGHPRASGTFCKILRKYVREERLISLPEAIKKMTLMPAKVLEKVVPEMKLRGRVQKGCFADLILFDPHKVKDNATYENGFSNSSGMDYVWVNGKTLISKGKILKNIFPGRPIKGSKINTR
ncbi:amidohydrolase family protein [Chryseobacterium indologenes]|uniref:D-glutamate deacylase n=1 Tax=Chryseobacterium indologenes TaxID=253 RepID=A0A0N0ZY61_CHRID|nr:amidohydrolase family protein [Chryseobacterium indologenes]KPE52299.1 D-glutamate deacylase [Chryseobacterium indologenes]